MYNRWIESLPAQNHSYKYFIMMNRIYTYICMKKNHPVDRDVPWGRLTENLTRRADIARALRLSSSSKKKLVSKTVAKYPWLLVVGGTNEIDLRSEQSPKNGPRPPGPGRSFAHDYDTRGKKKDLVLSLCMYEYV